MKHGAPPGPVEIQEDLVAGYSELGPSAPHVDAPSINVCYSKKNFTTD